VLSSLLPGLREIRAPLAAGCVWLLCGWLVVGHNAPPPSTAKGVLADLYRLAGLLGKPVTLAAFAVLAYVLGVLSTALMDNLVYAGNLIHRTRLAPLSPETWLVTRIEATVEQMIMNRIMDRFGRDDALRQDVKVTLAELLADEEHRSAAQERWGASDADSIVGLAERSLVRRWRLLWDVVDLTGPVEYVSHHAWLFARSAQRDATTTGDDRGRHWAEGDFRLALVLPLIALLVVLAARSSWLWLAGGVVPPYPDFPWLDSQEPSRE
jgi:hypothetical protein